MPKSERSDFRHLLYNHIYWIGPNLCNGGGEGTRVVAQLALEVFGLQMDSLDVLVQVTLVT